MKCNRLWGSSRISFSKMLPTAALTALLCILASKVDAQTNTVWGLPPATEIQENVNVNKFTYALDYALNAHNEEKSFTQTLEFSPEYPLQPQLPEGFTPAQNLQQTTCQLPAGLSNYSLYVWANPDTKKVVALVIEKTIPLLGYHRSHLITGNMNSTHPLYKKY